MDGNDYYVFTVIDEKGNKYNLEGDELYDIISSCNIYETINQKIKKDWQASVNPFCLNIKCSRFKGVF